MPVINTEALDITSDITTTTTLLHETIPMTGTIVSGTYGAFRSETNVKNYTHGMFQSVYDYPYLSSSSNHIFDLTCGFDETSPLSGAVTTVQGSKKINLYNQFAQVLLGYTASTGDGIRKFERDLNLDGVGTMDSVFMLSFSRLLSKDEIKRGSFSITVGTGSWDSPFYEGTQARSKTLQDISASLTDQGVKNTLGGDYALLFSGSGGALEPRACGLVFYQAGIVVLTSSIFRSPAGRAVEHFTKIGSTTYTASGSIQQVAISGNADSLRHRIKNISFNNTTEINSKIYFCRVPHNKFNYSSNPTYVTGSKIRVKNVASDTPISYITTVGLYNTAGELLAVAKLSEPLRKDPNNDMTIRVRLDY